MTQDEVRREMTIAQQQGTLVEIYNLDDDDTFDVGFVIAMDQLCALLLVLDWDGKINCLLVTRLTSVRRIRRQTDYLTTVTVKAKVAQDNGYFDVWGLQKFLQQHDFTNKPLLKTFLQDSLDNHLPVVIGTNKYKLQDDFEGYLTKVDDLKITMDYYNEHDLSSLWEYEELLVNIDYLRVRGYQMATTAAIFKNVFHR